MDQGQSHKASENSPPFALKLEGELLPHGLQGEKWAAIIRSPLSPPTQSASTIDVEVLPYDTALLTTIRAARDAGRKIVLKADPADPTTQRIASHLPLFDSIDPAADIVRKEIPHAATKTLRSWLSALRLHQWIKNALIFVPLLASHRFSNASLFLDAIIAFIAFGLCASSVYVLNDIMDLNDDRHHKSKRFRPFAAGSLSVSAGLAAFPLLLVTAFAIAVLHLPLLFAVVLAAYYLLTLFYSLFLKRLMAIDVIALAMLYTLRIFAGVAALNLTLTFWLLAFAMFLFLSLALAKRFAEIRDALERGRTGKTRGRDYDTRDLEMISSLGAASGYQAVMVLALYIHEQSTVALYNNPEFLWLACPVLLFWITRVWMLTHRGQMHEDPVVFAARDWISQVAGVMFLLIFLAAS